MRQVGRLAAILRRRRVDPADLLEVALPIGRPGRPLGVAELPFGQHPDSLVEGERLLLLEGGLNLIPRHRGIVLGRDAVARVPVVPGEARQHLGPGQQELPAVVVDEADAEGSEGHEIVGPRIGPVQHADLGRAFVHHILGQVRKVGHRELALLDEVGQALDECLVLADLAQHVLVVEEHPDLGVLRDGMNLALVLR